MHPVLVKIGSLEVQSYWVMAAAAFLLAAFWAGRRALRMGLTFPQVLTTGGIVLFFGVAGAHLDYVRGNWEYYKDHLQEILRLDEGGLSFTGGFLAATFAIAVWFRLNRFDVLGSFDRMLPPFVLSVAVARIGCLLHGCCYGTLTELPWYIMYPGRPQHRHPWPAYETGMLLLILAVLLWRERFKPRAGTQMALFGFLYGLWRLLGGGMRADQWVAGGGLNAFQSSGLFLMVLSALLFWITLTRKRLPTRRAPTRKPT